MNSDTFTIDIKNPFVKTISISLNENYPIVKLLKKTNNVFEVEMSENLLIRFKAQNNQQRDVIALTIRMFCG